MYVLEGDPPQRRRPTKHRPCERPKLDLLRGPHRWSDSGLFRTFLERHSRCWSLPFRIMLRSMVCPMLNCSNTFTYCSCGKTEDGAHEPYRRPLTWLGHT